MAISDYTRKLLWGRSGNRCAICRRWLIADATDYDREAIVADECHIVARSSGGARSGEISEEFLDDYDNLVLLCRVHHKQVDDQPNTFPSDTLRELKRAHELWVHLSLESAARGGDANSAREAESLFGPSEQAATRDVSNSELAERFLARARQRRAYDAWSRSEEALLVARDEVDALTAYLRGQVSDLAAKFPELGLEFEHDSDGRGCIVRTPRTSLWVGFSDHEAKSLHDTGLVITEDVGALGYDPQRQSASREPEEGSYDPRDYHISWEQYSFTQTKDGLPGWHVAGDRERFSTSLELADSYLQRLMRRTTDDPNTEHLW